MGSHLNERSETKKLLKVVDTKNQQIEEAKGLALKAKTIAEAKDAEVKRLVESNQRKEVLNELTGPLNPAQKEIMADLLESVQTAKLRASFDKYLPSVIDSKAPAKQKATLKEGKEITGNKTNSSIESSESKHNVVDIKRLAGL